MLVPSLAAAQPQPPDVDTLGPVVYSVESGSVKILSPKNSDNCVNPVQLNFTVLAGGMLGQFGNVGVSVDGGVINSVKDFVNKTVVQSRSEWYVYETTVLASVKLPTLSEGNHNVTIYYGWQYLGSNQRYQVFAHSTIDFTVTNASQAPEFNSLAVLLLVITATTVIIKLKKQASQSLLNPLAATLTSILQTNLFY